MMSLFERLREKALERKRRREERRQLRAQSSSGLGRVDPGLGSVSAFDDGGREIYPVDPRAQNVYVPYVSTPTTDTCSPSYTSSDSSSCSSSSSDSSSSSSGGSD